jgi:hypothetical protein
MKKRVFCVAVSLMVLAGIGGFLFFPWHEPEYCWLLFGPDAKVRVLVRLEGETVSLDHYANGKPTGRKEHFRNRSECENITLADPDGKTSYVITRMSGSVVKAGVPTELFVHVDINGSVNYRQYCDIMEMTDDPETARLAHFHGPLTVEVRKLYWKIPPGLCLQRGNKPTDIFVNIGTMDAEKGCWVVVRTHDEKNRPAFPKGVHPFVDVEFPPKKEADPSIHRRYPLEAVC